MAIESSYPAILYCITILRPCKVVYIAIVSIKFSRIPNYLFATCLILIEMTS